MDLLDPLIEAAALADERHEHYSFVPRLLPGNQIESNIGKLISAARLKGQNSQ